MKKICQLMLITMFAATMSSAAFGEGSLFANIIGFSRDGRYFAMEEFGRKEDANNDSGYSTIYIFNVAGNKLAVPPFEANGKWYRKSTYPGERVYEDDIKKRLREFGMTSGYIEYGLTNGYIDESFGTDLRTVNLNTSYSGLTTRNGETLTDEMPFTARFGKLDVDRRFDATLSKLLLPRENCDEFKRDMFSFELTIRQQGNMPRKLTNRSKNLICSDAYAIGKIVVYRNNFAVVAASFSKGVRAPDNNYFILTGTLVTN